MRRFLAICRKEFRQIRRDRLSLGMLILLPALLLIMYGYALSFDVKHIRMGVLDHDRTPASRRLCDALFQNPYFRRQLDLGAEREAAAVLGRRRAQGVIVIPRGYSEALARGESTAVQALVDAADANTASAAIGYLDALADRATREQRERWAGSASALAPSVRLEPRIWFNPDLVSARFLVPGLIGMLLMLSAVIATSLSIVREKENETMEQLRVSPVRPEELVLGKTIPYALICLLTMALVLVLGYALFGVAVQGSFLLLGAVTLCFLFAALGMGLLISAVTRSQQVAFQIAILTSLLPAILLSGLVFPIRNMPLPIQAITLLVVPRYFVSALREIIVKAAPLPAVLSEMGAMLLLGLLFNLLAARKLRKAS